ncbi:hypothetical protein [Candidatus Hodarchaeum mangrovi]
MPSIHFFLFPKYKAKINEIPQLILSKFHKLTFRLHETQGTLDSTDLGMDGILNLYDLGVVITHRIAKLSGHSIK